MDEILYSLASRVGEQLLARKLVLVTAESCTGGWLGEAVTMVPGSSRWYERGFITYSNSAKQQMLDVSRQTLDKFGAVSEAVVQEMVSGALTRSESDVAVAVSGVAGPDGGTADKPVGIVCIGWGAKEAAPSARTFQFAGDRAAVRRQAVILALEGVLKIIPTA